MGQFNSPFPQILSHPARVQSVCSLGDKRKGKTQLPNRPLFSKPLLTTVTAQLFTTVSVFKGAGTRRANAARWPAAGQVWFLGQSQIPKWSICVMHSTVASQGLSDERKSSFGVLVS